MCIVLFLLDIADFGVSGRLDNNNKRTTMTGTPYFIAPEVILDEGEGYDVKVMINDVLTSIG